MPEININIALFGLLLALSMGTAVGVVAFHNALRSALCLVANFFCLAVIYFTLQSEMLGIAQIVVYTGAIMVLFLFVIMLLHIGGPNALKEKPELRTVIGLGFGALLFGLVLTQVVLPFQAVGNQATAPLGYGTPEAVGRSLLTTYALPFEIASFLLLVGVVGSILLAKRKI